MPSIDINFMNSHNIRLGRLVDTYIQNIMPLRGTINIYD